MILCVSANPALDVCLRVSRLEIGQAQRASSVRRLAGGKAVHVALAARALGERVALVGWFGGASGQDCQRQLARLELETVAVPTRCETRQNIDILDVQGRSTEVLEGGGPVEPEEVERFVATCEPLIERLGSEDAVALCGSLPTGAPPDLFARIVTHARRRRVRTFVDTSGAALAATLPARPDWIKPNHQEAGALLGRAIDDAPAAIAAARALRMRGAVNVVVSRGQHGVVVADGARAWRAWAPPVVARSSVGCGDATVAGLAVATLRGASLLDAIKLAVACGHANCRASSPGEISADLVQEALASVEVTAFTAGAA